MIKIESIAYSVPEKVLTNADLQANYPEWNFERLVERTGVLERHIAAQTETALDFAESACRQLDSKGLLKPDAIDAVIFCTQSPDYIMPPNACILHGRLGLKPSVLAFDITLACSGYVYGLQIAAGLVACGAASRVLLATADTYSRFIHEGDRATRCLFGDGGAVSILVASEDGRGVRDIQCGTAGKHHEKFIIPAGGTRLPRSPETAKEITDHSGNVRTKEHIRMDGMGVLSFFNTTVPAAIRDMMARNKLALDQVDLFVFHQASQVVLDGLIANLKIPLDKVVVDLSEMGNLVSASIPVALKRAMDRGKAKPGQLALLCGFGVGLSWATALVDL